MKLFVFDKDELRILFRREKEFYKLVCSYVCYEQYTSLNLSPNLENIKEIAENTIVIIGERLFQTSDSIKTARDVIETVKKFPSAYGITTPPSPRNPSKRWFFIGIISLVLLIAAEVLLILNPINGIIGEILSYLGIPLGLCMWIALFLIIFNRPEDPSVKTKYEKYQKALDFINNNNIL